MMEQLLAKKKKQRSGAPPIGSGGTTQGRMTTPHPGGRSDVAPTRPTSNVKNDSSYQIPAPSQSDRTVQIGPGVEFEGTIQDCDELIIEGSVQAIVTAARLLILNEGSFSGAAMVSEAKVQGKFDGDLTAASKLTVESTGQVAGEIRYAKLEILSGGTLTGDIGVYVEGGPSALRETTSMRKTPEESQEKTLAAASKTSPRK
jgi:cytoskeletal protein CcmA (bactofilin family)